MSSAPSACAAVASDAVAALPGMPTDCRSLLADATSPQQLIAALEAVSSSLRRHNGHFVLLPSVPPPSAEGWAGVEDSPADRLRRLQSRAFRLRQRELQALAEAAREIEAKGIAVLSPGRREGQSAQAAGPLRSSHTAPQAVASALAPPAKSVPPAASDPPSSLPQPENDSLSGSSAPSARSAAGSSPVRVARGVPAREPASPPGPRGLVPPRSDGAPARPLAADDVGRAPREAGPSFGPPPQQTGSAALPDPATSAGASVKTASDSVGGAATTACAAPDEAATTVAGVPAHSTLPGAALSGLGSGAGSAPQSAPMTPNTRLMALQSARIREVTMKLAALQRSPMPAPPPTPPAYRLATMASGSATLFATSPATPAPVAGAQQPSQPRPHRSQPAPATAPSPPSALEPTQPPALGRSGSPANPPRHRQSHEYDPPGGPPGLPAAAQPLALPPAGHRPARGVELAPPGAVRGETPGPRPAPQAAGPPMLPPHPETVRGQGRATPGPEADGSAVDGSAVDGSAADGSAQSKSATNQACGTLAIGQASEPLRHVPSARSAGDSSGDNVACGAGAGFGAKSVAGSHPLSASTTSAPGASAGAAGASGAGVPDVPPLEPPPRPLPQRTTPTAPWPAEPATSDAQWPPPPLTHATPPPTARQATALTVAPAPVSAAPGVATGPPSATAAWPPAAVAASAAPPAPVASAVHQPGPLATAASLPQRGAVAQHAVHGWPHEAAAPGVTAWPAVAGAWPPAPARKSDAAEPPKPAVDSEPASASSTAAWPPPPAPSPAPAPAPLAEAWPPAPPTAVWPPTSQTAALPATDSGPSALHVEPRHLAAAPLPSSAPLGTAGRAAAPARMLAHPRASGTGPASSADGRSNTALLSELQSSIAIANTLLDGAGAPFTTPPLSPAGLVRQARAANGQSSRQETADGSGQSRQNQQGRWQTETQQHQQQPQHHGAPSRPVASSGLVVSVARHHPLGGAASGADALAVDGATQSACASPVPRNTAPPAPDRAPAAAPGWHHPYSTAQAGLAGAPLAARGTDESEAASSAGLTASAGAAAEPAEHPSAVQGSQPQAAWPPPPRGFGAHAFASRARADAAGGEAGPHSPPASPRPGKPPGCSSSSPSASAPASPTARQPRWTSVETTREEARAMHRLIRRLTILTDPTAVAAAPALPQTQPQTAPAPASSRAPDDGFSTARGSGAHQSRITRAPGRQLRSQPGGGLAGSPGGELAGQQPGRHDRRHGAPAGGPARGDAAGTHTDDADPDIREDGHTDAGSDLIETAYQRFQQSLAEATHAAAVPPGAWPPMPAAGPVAGPASARPAVSRGGGSAPGEPASNSRPSHQSQQGHRAWQSHAGLQDRHGSSAALPTGDRAPSSAQIRHIGGPDGAWPARPDGALVRSVSSAGRTPVDWPVLEGPGGRAGGLESRPPPPPPSMAGDVPVGPGAGAAPAPGVALHPPAALVPAAASVTWRVHGGTLVVQEQEWEEAPPAAAHRIPQTRHIGSFAPAVAAATGYGYPSHEGLGGYAGYGPAGGATSAPARGRTGRAPDGRGAGAGAVPVNEAVAALSPSGRRGRRRGGWQEVLAERRQSSETLTVRPPTRALSRSRLRILAEPAASGSAGSEAGFFATATATPAPPTAPLSRAGGVRGRRERGLSDGGWVEHEATERAAGGGGGGVGGRPPIGRLAGDGVSDPDGGRHRRGGGSSWGRGSAGGLGGSADGSRAGGHRDLGDVRDGPRSARAPAEAGDRWGRGGARGGFVSGGVGGGGRGGWPVTGQATPAALSQPRGQTRTLAQAAPAPVPSAGAGAGAGAAGDDGGSLPGRDACFRGGPPLRSGAQAHHLRGGSDEDEWLPTSSPSVTLRVVRGAHASAWGRDAGSVGSGWHSDGLTDARGDGHSQRPASPRAQFGGGTAGPASAGEQRLPDYGPAVAWPATGERLDAPTRGQHAEGRWHQGRAGHDASARGGATDAGLEMPATDRQLQRGGRAQSPQRRQSTQPQTTTLDPRGRDSRPARRAGGPTRSKSRSGASEARGRLMPWELARAKRDW